MTPYFGTVRRLFGLISLVATAGCGASAQQEVAATIRASDAAWERGDLDEGCALMTERARKDLLKFSSNPVARSCREAFEVVEEDPPPRDVAYLVAEIVESEPPRMTGIRVSGDTAVATYSNGRERELRKVNGRWLLDAH